MGMLEVRVEASVLLSYTFDLGTNGTRERVVHEWVITIPSAPTFRLEVSECPCGLWRQIGVSYKPIPMDAPDWNTHTREIETVRGVELTNCTCRSKAHRGPRPTERDRVCHGWHLARVMAAVRTIQGFRVPKIKTSMKSYRKAA